MDIAFLLGLGFVAGTFGGMLGIGGSVIMIPAMWILLGMPIHLAQAVAMAVNPVVAISAAAKHHRNRNISWIAVRRVLPLAIVSISLAAWLSNNMHEMVLGLFFGLFLIWVFLDQVHYLFGKASHSMEDQKTTRVRCGLTGGVTGATAGILGIGGGLIQVPLLNTLCRIPLKHAIGTSSAIMFFTAIIGATVKVSTLPETESVNGSFSGIDAFIGLLPGALIGGWFGAKLTKLLPVRIIRIVFAMLVLIAAIKMLTIAYVLLLTAD